MGLRFSENTNTTEMLRRLMDAAEEHQHKAFEVYTKETMPERFHFSHNERIAPIHVVPYLGWVITDRKRHPTPESGQRESLGVRLTHLPAISVTKCDHPTTEPRLR